VLKAVKSTGTADDFFTLERDLVKEITLSLRYDQKVVKELLGTPPSGNLLTAIDCSKSLNLYDQGKIDETIQLQQEILKAHNDLHYARMSLGKTYYSKGEIDNAIRELKELISNTPTFFLTYSPHA